MTTTKTLPFTIQITRAYPAKQQDWDEGVCAYFSANLVLADGTPFMALNGMQLVQDETNAYYIRSMRRPLANSRILSAYTFYPGAEKNEALRAQQKALYIQIAESVRAKLIEFGHNIEGLFES